MRLTLVTETFSPQVNGVSRTLGKLVDVLSQPRRQLQPGPVEMGVEDRSEGDRIQIVRPDYGKRERGRIDRDGTETVTVRALPLPFYPDVMVPLPPFGRVCRAIRAFRPDLIHIATEATLGWTALRFAIRERIPVVSSFHTNFDQYFGFYGFGWTAALVWRYLRWFHNQTMETYVPSPCTIRSLEARGFERLALWPRGVESDRFRPDRPERAALRGRWGWGSDVTAVGHVGRLAPEKNIEYLGQAFRIAADRRPNLRFLIVGDGPERPALESILGERAVFAGFRDSDDLADHYAAADLFAFASKTETFGNVVLEAMASGLPVLALAAGGIVDLIDDSANGRLLSPDSTPEQYAEALLELADNRETRGRLGQAARCHALNQSWDAIMMGLRCRYSRVLEGSRAFSEKIRKT